MAFEAWINEVACVFGRHRWVPYWEGEGASPWPGRMCCDRGCSRTRLVMPDGSFEEFSALEVREVTWAWSTALRRTRAAHRKQREKITVENARRNSRPLR